MARKIWDSHVSEAGARVYGSRFIVAVVAATCLNLGIAIPASAWLYTASTHEPAGDQATSVVIDGSGDMIAVGGLSDIAANGSPFRDFTV